MAEKAKRARPQVRKPEVPGARSAKADPDRKDTASGPKTSETSGAPPRDTHEWPSKNPEADPKGKVAPRPDEKPVTGA